MNIIVTGASKGIGYELARLFASDIKNKVLVLGRDRIHLEQLKRECMYQYPGAKILPVVCDLSALNFKEIIPRMLSFFDSVDILVNNAGLLISKPFIELEPKEVEDIFRVNVFAIMELTRTLLSYMGKAKEPSHIVNISSMGGVQGSAKYPGLSAYSASKAALISLTECLAVELSGMNIHVNCLALGAVQTEMFEKAFPGSKAPVKPAEMAQYIRDFATNGAKFFNGKIIPVALGNPE
jgi:short-subunit dehydrogenase